MKLNIGQNLRTLRRAADMTQEELAIKLGVTYQSVSRWENGGAYPDMELLPAIADIFGVTVDQLLSRERAEIKKELNSLVERLKTAVEARDTETVTDILRTVRRDLRRFTEEELETEIQVIAITLEKYGKEAPPGVLDEYRQYLDLLEMYRSQIRGIPVRALALIEDDEHLDAFLNKYSAHIDLSTDSLLRYRYQCRQETEKAAYMNQMHSYTTLCQFFRKVGSWDWQYQKDSAWMSGPCLRFLNDLHGFSEDSGCPVSGNGEPDLWAEERLGLGFQYAAYLVTQNRPDDALDVLEDATALLEKLTEIPTRHYSQMPPVRLTSSVLPDFTQEAHGVLEADSGNERVKRRAVHTFYGQKVQWVNFIYPTTYLKCLSGWSEFAPIREDPRFCSCLSRLEIITEPVTEEQREREIQAQHDELEARGLL